MTTSNQHVKNLLAIAQLDMPNKIKHELLKNFMQMTILIKLEELIEDPDHVGSGIDIYSGEYIVHLARYGDANNQLHRLIIKSMDPILARKRYEHGDLSCNMVDIQLLHYRGKNTYDNEYPIEYSPRYGLKVDIQNEIARLFEENK